MFRNRGKRKLIFIVVIKVFLLDISHSKSLYNKSNTVINHGTDVNDRDISVNHKTDFPSKTQIEKTHDGLITMENITTLYNEYDEYYEMRSEPQEGNTVSGQEFIATTLVPKPIDISNHLCTISRYKHQTASLKMIKNNVHNKHHHFKSFVQITDSLNIIDKTDIDTSDLATNTLVTSAPSESMLPLGCQFKDNNGHTKTVICTGEDISNVPRFSYIRDLDVLIFNFTSIQILDRKSIEYLPKVENLIFANGDLMRVAFNHLLSYQPRMTNLSLIHNSISSLSFSYFYNDPEKDALESLDLQNNIISNLPEVPVQNETVLHNLKTLMLSGNPMRVLPGDIFYPLRSSKVTTLLLVDSRIGDYGIPSYGGISPFEYLPHLKYLDFSHNSLSIQKLTGLLRPYSGGNITSLILDDNSYLQVPSQALENVKNSVEYLSFVRSSFYCLDNTSFPTMNKLKTLNMQFSRISQIRDGTFDSLVVLETLYLDGNLLVTIPPALSLSSLKVLTMNKNPSETKNQDVIFKIVKNNFNNSDELEVLSMSEDYFHDILNYFFQGLYKLKRLILTDCSIHSIQDGSFIDLNELEALYLASNKLIYITKNTFNGLVNLRYLDLSDNELNFDPVFSNKYNEKQPSTLQQQSIQRIENIRKGISKQTSNVPIDLFSSFSNLESLNMRDNFIDFLSPIIFEDMMSLREVDLSDNRVNSWNEPLFTSNPYLQLILLRNNLIKTLSESMIIDFDRSNLIVDLRDNIFNCDCTLHAFDQLNKTIFVDIDRYMCLNGTELVPVLTYINITLPCEKYIQINTEIHSDLTIFITLAVISVICITIATTTYRNRWYVKYLAYKLRGKVRYINNPPKEPEGYEFDTFICYSQSDRQWVFEKLVGKLEAAGSGLKVCVHERDFLVGEAISHNIIRSVGSSRKVLVIISKAFVQSRWCMFELQMASSKIIDENKNKLILILMEPIPATEQPKELKLLLRSRTYVSWVSDEEGEKLFWARLLRAISKPTSTEEHATSESSDVPMKTSIGSTCSFDVNEISSDSDFGDKYELKDGSANQNKNDQIWSAQNLALPYLQNRKNVKIEAFSNMCFEHDGDLANIDFKNRYKHPNLTFNNSEKTFLTISGEIK